MLLTTLLLAIPCLLHACSGWDRRAPHFHALFQFQLVGLNGAFLTGDIFNLFVFFEVMLIASYGLLLSGGRGLRMRIGLHYVVFNVTASTLFLIALGLLYASLGSLNMAELSQRIAEVPPAQLTLVKATMGLLLLVFCAKAALMPLYLWLPEAYSRAPAAVAALCCGSATTPVRWPATAATGCCGPAWRRWCAEASVHWPRPACAC
ncbi:hypothetical protein G6F59_015310 [Rhizopus arrhizus]|nr:hypothetical protein G6F59_015310 [Rhizopus arrhizus]